MEYHKPVMGVPQAEDTTPKHPKRSTTTKPKSSSPNLRSTIDLGSTAATQDRPSTSQEGFSHWLSAHAVTGPSITILLHNGITSEQLMAGLQPGDPEEMGLPTLGQRRLIARLAKQCLEELQAPAATPDGPTARLDDQMQVRNTTVPGIQACPPPQGLQPQAGVTNATPAPQPPLAATAHTSSGPLQDQLVTLLAAMPSANQATSNPPPLPPLPTPQNLPHASGERIDLYPLNYILPDHKVKFKDITDFINPMESRELLVHAGEGTELLCRTGPKKPKLESVTPMQWSATNMKIMVNLLREGELSHNNIMDYVAHTIKISELAQKYTWVSVLHYDRAYREMQQAYKYRWASDSPHLSALHLTPRGPSLKPSMNKSPKTSNTFKGPRPICIQYNKGGCTYGAACQFRHICSADGCEQAHPRSVHEEKK